MPNGSASCEWPPHINALYQEDTTQLRFMKRQQWVITNYFLILLAGIFGIVRSLPNVQNWTVCVAVSFIVIAMIVTMTMLLVIQDDMSAPRARLAKAYALWPPADREKFELTESATRRRRSWGFLLSLLMVCFFGALAVGYALASAGA